jgi:hypothetical protein
MSFDNNKRLLVAANLHKSDHFGLYKNYTLTAANLVDLHSCFMKIYRNKVF